MTVAKTIQLDIARVGNRMTFRVSSLDANGDEIAHDGPRIAQSLDRTDSAIEEAQALASEWCQQHRLKTFMMYDRRLYDAPTGE